MLKNFLWIWIALMLVACVPSTPQVSAEAYSTRIIIQFSERIEDPSDSRYVQQLSREVGARLDYLQPVGVAAHVYAVSNLRDAAELNAVLQRLAAQPEVMYAEQDRKVQKH